MIGEDTILSTILCETNLIGKTDMKYKSICSRCEHKMISHSYNHLENTSYVTLTCKHCDNIIFNPFPMSKQDILEELILYPNGAKE